MSIALFIVALLFLIFIHELGHFLFAKWTNCRVDEFAVGFKPALIQKKYGETNYLLGLLPLGGYVKIWGENGSSELEGDEDNPRAFCNRPRPAQALVLLGGIIFNVIAAWLLFVVVFMFGIEVAQSNFENQELQDAQVEVLYVLPDSPIAQAGIQEGDVVTELRSGEFRARNNAETMRRFIQSFKDEEIRVLYKRGDGALQQAVVTTYEHNGEQILGFGIEKIGTLKLGFIDAVVAATVHLYDLTILISTAIGELVTGLFSSGDGLEQLSGPVGIVNFAVESLEVSIIYFMYFIAILSLNLAIFNLLPFPALDGGRLVFVAIESITRRNTNPTLFLWINAIGFGLLLLLLAFVTYQDILKI